MRHRNPKCAYTHRYTHTQTDHKCASSVAQWPSFCIRHILHNAVCDECVCTDVRGRVCKSTEKKTLSTHLQRHHAIDAWRWPAVVTHVLSLLGAVGTHTKTKTHNNTSTTECGYFRSDRKCAGFRVTRTGCYEFNGRCDSVKALTQKNEHDVRKTAVRRLEQTSTAATPKQTARCVAARRWCCPMVIGPG